MAEPQTQDVLSSFSNFYESWLTDQQSFLQQLRDSLLQTQSLDKEQTQLRLISQVLSHYQQYYEHLSMAATENIFQVVSAPWLTSYERTLFWISGFKPTIIFRLLGVSVCDLTTLQAASVEDLKVEVMDKERHLTEAMASLQEVFVAPPIVDLVDGEVDKMETVIEELKMRMLDVLNRADLLRGSTLMKTIHILNTDQTVRLLVAVADFQLRIRRWGLPRNSNTRV